MVDCPVCGTAGPPEGPSCAVCGLPIDLFLELQEAAAEPAAPGPVPPKQTLSKSQDEAEPRRPETPPEAAVPMQPAQAAAASDGPQSTTTSTGADLMAKRAQGLTDELLEVGKGLGIDVSDLTRTLETARAQGDAHEAWKVRKELTPIIVGGLLDRYRQVCRARNRLSERSGTAKVDSELVGFRRALREGDIRRADGHLEVADQELTSLEETWTRIHAQIVETGQIVRELNELGGVAPSVLRQVADSLRVSGRPEPEPVEQRVLQAKSFLWHLLVPRIGHELSRSRALLQSRAVPPENADLIQAEILRLLEQLRAHRVGDALETSKWLRLELVSATRSRPRPAPRRSFLE